MRGLLVFLMSFASITSAIAEVGRDSDDSPVKSPSLSTPEPQATPAPDEPEASAEQSPPPQSLLSSAETHSPVDLGKTSVNSGFKLEPNTLDGSMRYELPLAIPPGRNGLQPSLSLLYSSRPSQETNLVGRGWSISIPYIELKNYVGSEHLYDTSAFYSSLSGDLVSTSDPTIFKPKVDDGDFLQYTLSANAGWTVTDKRGTVYKFGQVSSAQQFDPSNSAHVYKWMLQEVRDTNDNYISYSYTKDSNQIYPDVITYTGHGSSPGPFDIHFTKELRNDTAASTAEGFAVNTRYRISEIRAEVSDAWVRKYALAYATGDNGERDILTSITESGYDGSIVLSLPTSTYGYQSATDSWSEATSWDIPEPTVESDYSDSGTRFADVNGDGLPDLLRRDASSSVNKVYMNNGTGWTYNSSWTIPLAITDGATVHPGTLLVDVNGDGRIDIVRSKENATSSIYINSGTAWVLSSDTVPVNFSDISGNDLGVRVADVNGDGLPDLLHNTVWDGNKVYINNGSTWVYDSSWSLPEPTEVKISLNNVRDVGTRFVDVNGDGLVDVIRRDGSVNKVYLHNGNHGWTLSSSTTPVTFMNAGNDVGGRLEDINGDGLIDAINDNQSSYLNVGGAWAALDSGGHLPLAVMAVVGGVYVDPGTRLVDVDGDGLVDVLRYRAGQADKVYIREGAKPDLLAASTNQLGGVTSITYKGSPKYGLNPSLPLILDTVQKVAYNDGIGASWDTEYSYQGGLYYTGSLRDRKFAGFKTVSATDDLGFVTKQYFYQGDASSSAIGEYDDHVSKLGRVFRTEIYDNSGNLYAKTISKWDRYDRGDGASFVKLTQAVDFSYDGDSDHREKAETLTYSDSTGNLIQKIEWGQVGGSDDGTFTDTGTDKFTTTLSYATSTAAASTMSLLSQETTVDQNSNKVRERKIYYDTLALGSLDKGNATKEERWKANSTYIDTEKTYDSYGLVTQEKDPRDKVTTYAYDALKLYPATATNPLAQTTGRLYDYSSGKVSQLTDPNGEIFQAIYDSLDRIKEEKQPDSATPSTLVTKTLYAYTDTGSPKRTQKTEYLSPAASIDTYLYVDGFGRKVEERTEAEGANTFAVKDYQYDERGLLKTESLPYFSSGASFTATSSPAATLLLIRHTYDPLQRIKTITTSVGMSTNAYDDWKLTATDPKGKVKDLTKDAYGNLIEVVEHNGASAYTTSYEYNGNGKLTKLTDAGGNVRNFTYDGLGRRLSAEDLHALGDASSGTWTYAYDDAGNLTQTVSPRALTTDYAYNDVNQVLSEDYTAGAGTEITYTYGGCVNGTGRLCAVAMLSGANTGYTYDSSGRIAGETRTINGTTFATLYTYDRQGNTLTITYPDSAQVYYTFNTAGLLEKIERKENGGVFTNVVSNFDYSPLGQPATVVYANGVTTTNTYDSAKLYRLTHILTAAPGVGGGGGPATSTFYPNSGTGGPTGSATFERYISGEAWSTLRAGAGTYVSPVFDNPNNLAGAQSGISTNQWRALDRAIFTFDTSAIPDSDVIISATLSISGSNKLDNGTAISPNINVYASTPASNYNFTASNYGQIGTTAQSTAITYAGWSTTGYNDFVLNAAGLGNISKTGVTKFGTRNANYDVANVAPAWSSNTGHFLQGYLAQGADTSKYPKLVVVHRPALPPGPAIQDLNYTYDAVGNITQIVDASSTSAAKAVTYGYDDLHRLTSAVAINTANGANYTQTYAYDALGNIVSGPWGNYFYQGSIIDSNWANPHAVTSITGTAYDYDKDGNLTGKGTLTNTWNYKGQLIQAATSSSTSSYYYGHDGNRVWVAASSTNTYYPNQYYNTDGAKQTKQVYAGSQLVATIETVSSSVTAYYVHADHLGSTNVVSDSAGTLAQTLDYYPFGVQRISSGTHNEQRRYIGQIYDAATGLDYLNARYYEGGRGQFISQDPVFWETPNAQNLTNPQTLNSYAYANGNPITGKDPSGRQYVDVNAAYAVPAYGVPVGPAAGFYVTPADGGNPYIYIGITVANKPGASASASYTPEGSPKEGWGFSTSGFVKNRGLQIGTTRDENGKLKVNLSPSVGTQGISVNLTYTFRLSDLFDPLEYISTPAYASPFNFSTIKLTSGGTKMLQASSPSNSARGSNFLSSASSSISAASRAISRGDYAAASKYLGAASSTLRAFIK
ncbi:MAG TPA: FG-GAP-like repeat-containing protein [Thermoanaerobaculia bacterium]|jgi:RHS repeat-associated protein|nr:FG-GAP-like repeat-containing protein [Thermoanaerobaculia bacterium]